MEPEPELLLQEARENVEAAQSYRRELGQRLQGLREAQRQVRGPGEGGRRRGGRGQRECPKTSAGEGAALPAAGDLGGSGSGEGKLEVFREDTFRGRGSEERSPHRAGPVGKSEGPQPNPGDPRGSWWRPESRGKWGLFGKTCCRQKVVLAGGKYRTVI